MFRNNDWKVNVKTVGDLVLELSRLPKDMPCHQGFSDSTDIVVFDSTTDPFVEFSPGGDWADADE